MSVRRRRLVVSRAKTHTLCAISTWAANNSHNVQGADYIEMCTKCAKQTVEVQQAYAALFITMFFKFAKIKSRQTKALNSPQKPRPTFARQNIFSAGPTRRCGGSQLWGCRTTDGRESRLVGGFRHPLCERPSGWRRRVLKLDPPSLTWVGGYARVQRHRRGNAN